MGIGSWFEGKKLAKLVDSDSRFWVEAGANGVLCPYCIQVVPKAESRDDQIDEILDHVMEDCKRYKGIDTPLLEQQDLKRARFINEVKDKIRKEASWRVIDKSYRWFCPYCTTMPGIIFNRAEKSYDDIAREVSHHLSKCFEYSQDPEHFKSVDQIKASVMSIEKEKTFAAKVRQRIEADDPVYLQKSPDQKWICPYCTEVVRSVSLTTEILIRFTAPAQMAQHLMHSCPSATKGEEPKSLEEIKKVAEALKPQTKAEAAAAGSPTPNPEDSAVFGWIKSEIVQIRQDMKRNEVLEDSIKKARQVVMKMLPESIPEPAGYELACHFEACDAVGGDFYDFIELEEGKLGIAVGDVSGHGLEAALVMGMTKKALNMRAKASRTPRDTIGMTNNDIFPDLERQTFVTCFYGVLDLAQNNMEFIRAGHTLTLAYRAKTKEVEVLRSNGMALGMTTGPMFVDTVGDLTVEIGEGDMLLQYTDGVIEAIDKREEEFGMQRLMDGLKKFGSYDAEYAVDKLAKTVKDYMGDAMQNDDITILCLKRTGVDLEARKKKMLE